MKSSKKLIPIKAIPESMWSNKKIFSAHGVFLGTTTSWMNEIKNSTIIYYYSTHSWSDSVFISCNQVYIKQ
tara:strand:+ start:210 stop:422 length:213 start_codon:yes stop_codon:yes gene_type:complete